MRYCGEGDAYTPGGVKCAACTAYAALEQKKVDPPNCDVQCSDKYSKAGDPKNGGEVLNKNGVCEHWVSRVFNGVVNPTSGDKFSRFCGEGKIYEYGGMDCTGCKKNPEDKMS